MALPVTISSVNVGQQNSYHGPFKSSGGNFYTVLLDSTNTALIEAHKATDPTVSFSEQDGANRPNLGTGVASLNIFQEGDNLHVAAQKIAHDVYYALFSMSSDAWQDVDPTAGIQTRFLVDGLPNGTADACDITVRSDGDKVIPYQGQIETVMGNPFERVEFASAAIGASAFTAHGRVDNQGKVERDMIGPRIVLGDSDTSHIVWKDDLATPTMSQRANSSADALQTERTDVNGADDLGTADYSFGHGVSFDRAGTTKIRFSYRDAGNDLGILEFDAAADPSTFTQNSNVDGGNNIGRSCLAADGSTVHEMHKRISDSDLYTANDADSDTWTAPASTFTGTINHVSCNVYDRSGTKLAHIIDDGGTVKYDEDALAAGDTTISVPQDSLAETDNIPALNTGVTVLPPQDSLAETDNDPTLNTGVNVAVPQDALTETDNAPTVPQIVGVPQDSLAQTDNVPDIRTGVTVAVPADALTQADNVPGINTGVTVASPQDSLSQADNAPTVPQIVGVPADSLSQVDNAPDIRTGVNVAVPQDALSETDNVPVIQTSIGVPQDSLAQTDQVPSINTGVAVSAPQDALTETDNAPAVGTGVIVAAPQDALAQADNTPSLFTGVNVVTPQDALTQADNAPALNTGVTVEPPADTLTQVDNAPTIGSGTQIDAPQDSLAQTDNIPALNTGVTVESPQDSLAQNDNVPVVSGGVLILVPADTLSVVDNVPGIATGARIDAPADALSVADQAPLASTGVNIAIPANDNLTIVDFAPVITAGPAAAGAARILRTNPMMVTLGKMMNR